MAKGMGNGFPVGGILIHPAITPWHGMLGTTYGGNPLACAATLAVLEIMDQEHLITQARHTGAYLIDGLSSIPGIQSIRGRGLMIGIELSQTATPVRRQMLTEHHIFTGSATEPHTIRLLPPLTITREEVDRLIDALTQTLQS